MKELLSKVDHTLLTVGCTWDEIQGLCDDAKAFGTASVCIPPCYVKKAAEYLKESDVKVCTVIGFPNGYAAADAKAFETKLAVIDGADEIDMVINVGFLKEKNYDAVLDEIVKVREACGEFRSRGIDVVSLGMFTDLRNPDKETRQKHIDYAKRYIEFAAESDIKFIASECGFTPGKRGINADTYESDYQNIKETLREICLEAQKVGVQIALEGCVLDIIPSPRRLKTLIEELEHECGVRLAAMLDPANYLAASDEEGMFYYLKHDVGYFHGKDRKINATYGVNIGDGDIDWVRFMICYIKYTDRKPFILEYCNADNCEEIKRRAEEYYDKAFHTLLTRIM